MIMLSIWQFTADCPNNMHASLSYALKALITRQIYLSSLTFFMNNDILITCSKHIYRQLDRLLSRRDLTLIPTLQSIRNYVSNVVNRQTNKPMIPKT